VWVIEAVAAEVTSLFDLLQRRLHSLTIGLVPHMMVWSQVIRTMALLAAVSTLVIYMDVQAEATHFSASQPSSLTVMQRESPSFQHVNCGIQNLLLPGQSVRD
jgi:hypothetical protein